MLATAALSEAKGLVDSRFLLTAFFPLLVFSLALAWILGAASGTLDSWVSAWEDASTIGQLVLAIVVVPVTFLLAMFVANNMQNVVKWYSGRALARVADVVFPRRDAGGQLLQRDATDLGVALASAQSYAKRAYGIDVGATWPRLSLLLPDKALTDTRRREDNTYVLLLVSLLMVVLTVVGAVASVWAALGAWLFLAFAVGGSALSLLAYRGAVGAMQEYIRYVRGAYDLYRNELLKQLGVPLPATGEEERRLWPRVSNMLIAGQPRPVRYFRAKA